MLIDLVTTNAPEVSERAQRWLSARREEHERYYARHGRTAFGGSCGYRDLPGGGRWLSSSEDYFSVTLEGNAVRLGYAGRRHGLIQDQLFVQLLQEAWTKFGTIRHIYNTQQPQWLPWETRDDHVTAKRISLVVDEENNAELWWAAARASACTPACIEGWVQAASFDPVELTAAEAEEVLAWAQSLPGWDGGPEHAPHPLLFAEGDVND
jgi:hypothetical protein